MPPSVGKLTFFNFRDDLTHHHFSATSYRQTIISRLCLPILNYLFSMQLYFLTNISHQKTFT